MFKKFNIMNDLDFLAAQSRISNLELEIEKLKTHINSLRGLINRRSKEIFEDKEPTETTISPDGLDQLRKANG